MGQLDGDHSYVEISSQTYLRLCEVEKSIYHNLSSQDFNQSLPQVLAIVNLQIHYEEESGVRPRHYLLPVLLLVFQPCLSFALSPANAEDLNSGSLLKRQIGPGHTYSLWVTVTQRMDGSLCMTVGFSFFEFSFQK